MKGKEALEVARRANHKEHMNRELVNFLRRVAPKKTNADRIRAMSDEEMAKRISCGAKSSEAACRFCENNNGEFCDGEKCRGKTDEEIILEWLRRPAEDNDEPNTLR